MNETASASTRLAPATAMGAVTLLVGDLDAQTAFYRDVVTLQVLGAHSSKETGDSVTLGRAGRPLVILQHEPSLRHATRDRRASSTPRSCSRRRRRSRRRCTPWRSALRRPSRAAPIIS